MIYYHNNVFYSHSTIHIHILLFIVDGISKKGFIDILNKLRSNRNDSSALTIQMIQEAFDALYYGSCLDDKQRDAKGMYINEADLRHALTSSGEVLTDEEADELLRECKPENGRIYFDQYKTMLLDSGY